MGDLAPKWAIALRNDQRRVYNRALESAARVCDQNAQALTGTPWVGEKERAIDISKELRRMKVTVRKP